MGQLIIEGSDFQLSLIAKTQSARAKKYGLKISLNQDKKGGANPPLHKDQVKPTARKVAELIAKCESIKDLKQYEGDGRQEAKNAYNKKLKELNTLD